MKQLLLYAFAVWHILGKWLVALSVGWISLWWRRWRRSARRSRMEGWPSVDGRILYGKVVPVPKTTKYLATLTYSYYVDEFRSGTYDIEFSREADADELARNLKDREIQVRYKPSNPEVSCPELAHIENLATSEVSLRPAETIFHRLAGRFVGPR